MKAKPQILIDMTKDAYLRLNFLIMGSILSLGSVLVTDIDPFFLSIINLIFFSLVSLVTPYLVYTAKTYDSLYFRLVIVIYSILTLYFSIFHPITGFLYFLLVLFRIFLIKDKFPKKGEIELSYPHSPLSIALKYPTEFRLHESVILAVIYFITSISYTMAFKPEIGILRY